MYWGSLLGIGDALSGAIDGIKEAVYQVGSFFGQILYSIWRLLAWVIDQIELVFSSLAGLDTQGGEDLVSKIINNKSVQAILSNMIAISMVIIVFFTIIKILQDHYKEKDGGNPYKVVISTFKGMLMFFFVGIAVTVGIQAAGVFLRGLDAATSGGSTTLSGQVFKAMAADANRKRKGKDGDGGFFADVANKYWSRTSSEGGIEHGKYAMVQMKDNGQTKTQADLLKIYEELCPEYKYGIVGSDGKVTPLNPSILSLFKDSLSTQDVGAELGSNVEKWYGTGEKVKYDNDTEFGDGSGEVTAGYKNDIFQAVTLNIKPSINLTWSPVDIVTSYYEMMADGDPIAWDLNVTFLGTGFNLSFMIEKVKYFKTSEIKKSLEDSAKQFGISINASAGLQDGEVSASFKLDMFDPQMFMDLLASILVNVVYTNMMQFMVEAIPSMYVRYVIGPVTINLLQLFGPLIFDCTETLMNNSFGELIPTVKEKDEETGKLVPIKDDEGNDIKMVQAFAHNESSHNGGVWVNANSKSPNIPLSIEKYIVDGNFEELWSQLTDNWNQFVEQMETSAEAAYDQFDENVQQIEDANLRGQEQADWQSYKALVDEYNDYAVGYLGQLGKLLSLFETALLSAQISAEDYVANEDKLNAILPILGYSGNMKSLEADIQEVFTYLVASYNESVSSRANRVPRGSYADAIYTQSLYKPIIEFPNYSTKIAETMDLYEIRNALIKENNKVKVNMFAEQTSDGGYNTVRQIDWKNYGPKFSQKFGKDKPIADLYYVEDADGDSNPDNANTPTSRLKKDAKTVVYFTTMDGFETWDQSDGLSYFYNDENPDSPFLKYEGQKEGTGSDIYLATGYWGDRGLTVEGDRYYQAYTGTTLDITNKNNCWDGKSTYEGSSTASLSTRSSSARVNSALQANRAATMKEISTFADVSEEKSELAKEFAKNIITFRPLDSESSDDDVKVLKDWCEPKDSATLTGKFDTYMLPTIEAERIDDLMAMGGGLRNYLMLTPDGTSEPDNGKFKSFVGFFSYSDPRTVKALYEMGDINYAVGFIAIISAAGVYLNFAFGLIQRAVNMAVLYIMSPISISFFPFDDGAKFKQQFVTPFYKEAISAFAVIISLNIFTLLLEPIQEAVEVVTGNAMIGWLGLVAMVSMLPKVRETIQGVLGAGGLAQKSLGQMFNDAGKALGVDSAKKLARKTAGGIAALQKAKAARDMKKQAKMAAKQKKLEEKEKEGKLSNFQAWRKKRMDDKLARDNKIAEAFKTGNKDNLSKSEQRRLKQLEKAAENKAMKEGLTGADADKRKAQLMNDAGFRKGVNGLVTAKNWLGNTAVGKATGKVVGGVKGAANTVADKAKGLAGTVAGKAKGLADAASRKLKPATDFFGKVAGKTKDIAGKVGGKVKDVANGVKNSAFGEFVADKAKGFAGAAAALGKDAVGAVGRGASALGRGISSVGQGISDSLVGELVKGKIDSMKDDKNSLFGSFLRWKDPRVNNKLRKEFIDKEIAKQKELADPLTDLTAGIEMLVRKDIEGEKQVNELAKSKVIKKELEKHSVNDKIVDMLVANELGANPDANVGDLRKKAKQDAANLIRNLGSEKSVYNSLGGDEKYATALLNGHKEFAYASVPPINFDDDAVKQQIGKIETELRKQLAKGTVSIKAELETLTKNQDTQVQNLKEALTTTLSIDNDHDKRAVDKILDDSRNDPTATTDKIIDKIVNILGSNKREIVERTVVSHDVAARLHSDDISELKSLLAASQAADKGKEMFVGKIGNFVSDADKEKIADAFRAARDTSAASTNPNSIGYRIEHEVNQNSNLSDAEKAKRREEITYEVKANAEAILKSFRTKYEDDMREYSAAKKYREASSAVEAVAMVSELQNQRDYHMNVNMQVPDIQMIVNDGLIQKLHESGDYAGAGYKLQELVTAIKQHDDAKAIQLGFDEATIEKMKKLESSGQIARLKSIQELGEFDAAYMGNISDSMGGSGLSGMEAAFAQLTRVAESKTIAEKFKVAADDFAHREAQNRAIVEQTLKKIESTMTGSAWEELANNMGVNISKLSSTLTDAMSGVNKGTHSMEDVKSVIDAVTAYRNDNLDKPAIVETLDMVLGGFSSANLANEQCDQTNALRSKLSDLEGSLQDIMRKLKPLLGGK